MHPIEAVLKSPGCTQPTERGKYQPMVEAKKDEADHEGSAFVEMKDHGINSMPVTRTPCHATAATLVLTRVPTPAEEQRRPTRVWFWIIGRVPVPTCSEWQ